jgi:hypothetical protein
MLHFYRIVRQFLWQHHLIGLFVVVTVNESHCYTSFSAVAAMDVVTSEVLFSQSVVCDIGYDKIMESCTRVSIVHLAVCYLAVMAEE